MTGTCPACKLKKRLTVKGVVYRHGDCAGGGKRPQEEVELLANGFTHQEIVDLIKSLQEMRDGDLKPALPEEEHVNNSCSATGSVYYDPELQGYRPEMPKTPHIPLRKRLKRRWRTFWNNMDELWDDAMDVWDD